MNLLLSISYGKAGYDISFAETGQTSDALETAVIISLFTWARAKEGDDVLPNASKHGWWGDQIADDPRQRTGSRLWLLARRKLTQDTVNDAVEYCKEALQWLISDGIISRLSITPEVNGMDELDMAIVLYRNNGQAHALRFNELWNKVKA